MKEDEIQESIKKAVALFKEGYNCSQAVFMAYSDRYAIEKETAAKIASSFGGGMGRLREVCGAVSGMFMVIGLEYPFIDPKNKDAKNANYKKVQETASEFRETFGTIICADLLKIKRAPQNHEASERTSEYYASRPCIRCVARAAEIAGKHITLI